MEVELYPGIDKPYSLRYANHKLQRVQRFSAKTKYTVVKVDDNRHSQKVA